MSPMLDHDQQAIHDELEARRPCGGPAFPLEFTVNKMLFIELGMTLRDYFAAQVVMSFRFTAELYPSGPRKEADAIAEGARFAYLMADAMIAARAK